MDWVIPFFAVGGVVLVVTMYKLTHFSSEPEGWWTRAILQDRNVKVRTDWNLCMGAGSCTELAPGVFKLDWSKKKKSRFDPAPLEVNENVKMKAEEIFRAAQSCPYRAIILEDQVTGDRLFPSDASGSPQ